MGTSGIRQGLTRLCQALYGTFNPHPLSGARGGLLLGLATGFAVLGQPASQFPSPRVLQWDGDVGYLAQSTGGLAVVDPPVFLEQPQPTNAPVGTEVVLRSVLEGTPPFTLQWYRNGTAISGARSETHSFRNSPGFAGLYWLVASNAAGRTVSRWVTVSTNVLAEGLAVQPRGSVDAFPLGSGSGAPVRMQVRGDLAYVVNGWTTNLDVVEFSDPDHPRLVSRTPHSSGGYPFGIGLVDDHALVPVRHRGLAVFDLSNPVAPVEVRTLVIPGSLANSIVVRDRIAYVGAEDGGLLIFDASNPTDPQLVGQWRGRGRANGVALEGNRAFIAHWSQGIEVVDISDPARPKGVGVYPVAGTSYSGQAFDAFPWKGRLYVIDALRGLPVLDTASGANPLLLAGGASAGPNWDLRRADRFLFAAGSRGLSLMDVDNVVPVALGNYPVAGGGLLGLELRGNRLLACGRQFQVLDLILNGMSPQITGAPESRRVAAGRSLFLEVAAAGSEPLRYQWSHAGKELEGETGPRLFLNAVTAGDAGDYTVRVSNAQGTAETSPARLEILASAVPVLSLRPAPPSGVQLVITAGEGLRLTLQRSTNLRVWTDVQSVTTTAPETVIPLDAPTLEPQFYRAEGL